MKIKHLSLFSLAIPGLALAQDNGLAPPPPPEELRAPEPETTMSQEEFYARDYGVSVSEARDRFEAMRDSRMVTSKLRESYPDSFAGVEIVHRPEFQFIARFTDEAVARTAMAGLPEGYTYKSAEFSEKQARARQEAIGRALRAAEVPYNSALRADGTVDIYVENADVGRVAGLLRAAGIEKPDSASVCGVMSGVIRNGTTPFHAHQTHR